MLQSGHTERLDGPHSGWAPIPQASVSTSENAVTSFVESPAPSTYVPDGTVQTPAVTSLLASASPSTVASTDSSPSTKKTSKQDMLLAEFEANPIPDLEVLVPKLGMSRKAIRDFFSKRRRLLGIEGRVPALHPRRSDSSSTSSSHGDVKSKIKEVEVEMIPETEAERHLEEVVKKRKITPEDPHQEAARPKRSRQSNVNYNVDNSDDEDLLVQTIPAGGRIQGAEQQGKKANEVFDGHVVSEQTTPSSTKQELASQGTDELSHHGQTQLSDVATQSLPSVEHTDSATVATAASATTSGPSGYFYAQSSFLPVPLLSAFFDKNPFPTWDEIDNLRAGTDLTRRQLGDWFTRHRRMNGITAAGSTSASSGRPRGRPPANALSRASPASHDSRGGSVSTRGKSRSKGGRPRKKGKTGHGWMHDDDENDYGSTTTDESDHEHALSDVKGSLGLPGIPRNEKEYGEDALSRQAPLRDLGQTQGQPETSQHASSAGEEYHSTQPATRSIHSQIPEFDFSSSNILTYAHVTRPVPGARPLTYFVSAPVPVDFSWMKTSA